MKLQGKTLKILLVFSLMVNLIIIGSVAGFFLNGRHKDPRVNDLGAGFSQRGGPRDGPLIGGILRAMEQSDRRTLGRALQTLHREAGRMSRADRNALRIELAQALRSTPFDAEKLEALLSEMGNDLQTRIELSQGIIVQHLGNMSDEKRSAIADALERRRPRRQ